MKTAALMSGNTFGTLLRLTSFGESHGHSVGGILDGVPPNMPLNIEAIQQQLDRRRPGASAYVSQRREPDVLEILSGVFDGKTLGTPIAFQIQNTNQNTADYDAYKNILRPGHGDYSYQMKYGHRDHRGGGRASARETVARVVAGAIALQILEHILLAPVKIQGCILQLGAIKVPLPVTQFDWQLVRESPFSCPCPKTEEQWQQAFSVCRNAGTSVGAVVYVEALGMPAGLGEPVFDKLDADIAKALMGINAVKAVAIGDTFDISHLTKGYDEMQYEKDQLHFTTNRAGGILAGISSSQPITALAAFKPTSSTLEKRQAVTLDGNNTTINVAGRHDPCVALRAIPIVEAMLALTLADHLLRFQGQCGHIKTERLN